jgi:hypothetical protein
LFRDNRFGPRIKCTIAGSIILALGHQSERIDFRF